MGATQEIHAAAVAGLFYPREAGELRTWIQTMFHDAGDLEVFPPTAKALIVPHAGYIYSGPVAAMAYAGLSGLKGVIRRVVLLGPTHHVLVSGLALPGVQAFETPLGRVPLDGAAVRHIQFMPQVSISPAAHAQEHSIEVQLPFLQQTLGDFQIVPLAVGDATPGEVAEVIEALWGGPETLIVVSSDLSHYLPYDLAQKVDHQTCERILELHELESHEQACGATPVNGLLLAAQHHHLTPHLLDLRNSGDTAGDRRQVVGYAAFVFSQESNHDP